MRLGISNVHWILWVFLSLAVEGCAFSFLKSKRPLHHHTNSPKNQHVLLKASTTEESLTISTPNDESRKSNREERPGVLDENPFSLMAGLASRCLFESDLRRDAIGQPGGTQASSATNWINDKIAFVLQKAFDQITLKLEEDRTGLDRDEASKWIRWMRSAPTPLIVDLSPDLRDLANETLTDESLSRIDTPRSQFLSRLGCRLILLPSGASLSNPLEEPPASIIYGKLLYGGVTRYRSLVSSNSNRPPRKAGERTQVKTSPKDNAPVWLQYGGPNRMYEAVDMGAAAILELMLLPFGKAFDSQNVNSDMAITRMVWSPQNMFGFLKNDEDDQDADVGHDTENISSEVTPMTLSGKERNSAFKSDFQSSVGGLGSQIDAIVRRVLDGRVIRPAEDDDDTIGRPYEQDETSAELSIASMEAEELTLLGLTPVRGLLLYGPPGCGKTALAREISRALKARAPKIVSAPELLDRWVGGSEKLVRALFADAEAELAACNGDATKSALHVVVIDEIDAVFRKRSNAEDSGETTRSSVVNQILAKLDGVNAIPNVLLIGMTNRRELLDEALLRPGRLEVQIEIPLPNKEGRREILQIHFDALRKKGRLSKPLSCAIDGVIGGEGQREQPKEAHDVKGTDDVEKENVSIEDVSTRAAGRKRKAIKRTVGRIMDSLSAQVRPSYDLAADYATGGFSGADIAGLVRCAGSLALARARRDGGGAEGLLITLEDVKEALGEVKG